MPTSVKGHLLTLLAGLSPELQCPKCAHRFRPFAHRTLGSLAELRTRVPCPKCGAVFTFDELVKTTGDARANPPGPFTRPPETRIELRPAGPGELLFYLPASGRWDGWLFFALFWNAITLTVSASVVGSVLRGHKPPAVLLGISLFVLIGAGVAYVALRTRFAVHQLHLGPEIVRLQRRLFFNTVHELPTAQIDRAKKSEFYRKNYQPVLGIEIGAGKSRLRFGSLLTEAEKDWLCAEIREFLRRNGAPV